MNDAIYLNTKMLYKKYMLKVRALNVMIRHPRVTNEPYTCTLPL
jgi:hypothetical protein